MGEILKLGFSGDFSLSGFFRDSYEEADLTDEQIREFWKENDYNIINFESPVTRLTLHEAEYLSHRCDPAALEVLKANVKSPVISFANNHVMDYGPIGIANSMEYAEAAGIPYLGIGRNLEAASRPMIFGKDVKVGILATQYKCKLCADPYQGGTFGENRKQEIRRRLSELRKTCDHVVLLFHGGEEFYHAPMPYIRRQLKQYLDWGADLIVAHHPHVVQGYETFGKKMIFYSLGNFVFDTEYQRVQEDTDRGMLLRLIFTKEAFSFETIGTRLDREHHRVTATGDIPYFSRLNGCYRQTWTREVTRESRIAGAKARLDAEKHSGVGLSDVEQNGVGLSGVGQCGVGLSGVGQCGVAQTDRLYRICHTIYYKLIRERKEIRRRCIRALGRMIERI